MAQGVVLAAPCGALSRWSCMLSTRLDIICSQESPDLLVRGQCHRERDLRMEKLRPG